MVTKARHEPMPHTHAHHLLNPLRGLILSPRGLVKRLDLKPNATVLELGHRRAEVEALSLITDAGFEARLRAGEVESRCHL